MFRPREVIFSMVFSHLGTGCKGSSSSSKSMGSEVTLGIFGVQFWGFSVLQRHGVSPPGGDFFHGVFPFGDRM